jgi:hypothetical protein
MLKRAYITWAWLSRVVLLRLSEPVDVKVS